MGTYSRAEIVEDRTTGKLRVYLISGDKRVLESTCDLRWDYADVDIDEIRDDITKKYDVPPVQITKRVEDNRCPARKRKARKGARRGPSR